MANTGVKRIKHAGGSHYNGMGGGKVLVLEAGKDNNFEVAEWLPNTSQADKDKINWQIKDIKRKTLLKELHGNEGIVISISKKYSGSQALFLLDAASASHPDQQENSGIFIRGYTPPLVASSAWSTTRGGANIKNGTPISYGDEVFLHLETEGLNASMLTVEVYNQRLGPDKKIFVYTNVPCINGEVNLEIRNTFAWRGAVGAFLGPLEFFYVKVRDGNTYLVDAKKQDLHAVDLKIKQQISSNKTAVPVGLSPAKMGASDVNTRQYELCKYSAITVKEDTRVVKIFDEKPPVPATMPPFEVVAGLEHNIKTLNIELADYNTDKCLQKDQAHKSHKTDLLKNGKPEKVSPQITGHSPGKVELKLKADMPDIETETFKYIWIPGLKPAVYTLALNTCRYARNLTVNVYPDIKWELEFKWNHDASFAFLYSNAMSPYLVESGRQSAIGSAVDAGFAQDGEMAQSFELTLKAKWDKDKGSIEVGKKIAEKIGKTLKLFVKAKEMIVGLTKQVSAKTPFSLNIKTPAIAASIGWYLDEQKAHKANQVATIVEIKVGAEPLIGAEFKIDLIAAGAEIASPAVASILKFLRDKAKENLNIEFSLTFIGNINVKGSLKINTSDPSLTEGSVTPEGEIKVEILLKAFAKGKTVVLGTEASGEVEASVKGSTGVTGGVEVGADEKGVYFLPKAEFAGIIVTYVLKGTIKFGVMKKTFDKSPEPTHILEPSSIKFDKNNYYLNHH